MSRDLEVGVRLTADGKGLVGETRAAKDAIKGLGDETRKTGSEMEQSAGQANAYTKNLGNMASGVSSIIGKLALLKTTLVGLAGISLFRGIIQESDIAQRNLLRTEAIIKATGQTAGLTAEQLRNQARELARATLQSTEGVEQAQQVLLTFRSVAGETFTRATELAADLATVTGQGLTGAMTQLGKALESPIDGINALRRSGVSFTDAQRDMIKTLVETNRLAEAQGLILDELTRQYGGVAKAEALGYAGAVDTLGQAWQELKLALDDALGVGEKMAWVFNTLASAVDAVSESVRRIFNSKTLGDIHAVRVEIFKTEERIRELEAKRSGRLGFMVDPQAINFEKIKLRELKQELGGLIQAQAAVKASTASIVPAMKPVIDGQNGLTKATQGQISESHRFLAALRREVEQLGLTRTETLRLQAAKLGVLEISKPLIDALDEETLALEKQAEAKRQRENDLRKIEQITQSVMTGQEQFAARVQELDRLMAQGLGVETYNRALKQAEEQFLHTGRTGQETFRQLDQFAVQAARNVQIAFSRYFFNPFEGGLKGLVTGLGNAIRQMLAEVAAMKFAQSLGLGSMLGLGSAGAMASGGGGFGMSDALNIGSTAANLFSTGLGATKLAGSAISGLGSMIGSGSTAAFGAGMAGGKAGAFLAAEATGKIASAASMGASFAAVAGPAIVLFAVDQIGRMLAGNKSTGTFVDSIPVIGGFAGALFGRGPLRQRATTLSGTIGTEGFEEGGITTAFRARGGLFRSNRNNFARVDALTGEITTNNNKLLDFAADLARVSREVIGLINDTMVSVSASLNQIGADLGLSTAALDAFQTQIHLVSENGKMLTEQQIGEEIARISEEMARSLLPELDNLSRRGETALQTVTRLNAEFHVLTSSATILGLSLGEAREAIRQMGFERRTEFVMAAGGIDALAQRARFFADHFLTDAERLQPAIDALDEQMSALGLSATITKDQFRNLVQSFGQVGGISEEMLHSLLAIAPLFVEVKDGLNKLGLEIDATIGLTMELAQAERMIAERRGALINAYQRERAELENLSARFGDLALSLRSASDSLSLGSLSPLTPQERLEEARTQFNRDRMAAASGDQQALARLPESARAFLEASQVFNASSAEFVSDFELVKSVLDAAAMTAQTEADIAQRQLLALDDAVLKLVDIDRNLISVEQAIMALTQAVLQGMGNPAISDQQIRDFINTPGMTTEQAVQAAVRHGVSGGQIQQALGVDTSVINRASGGATISDQQIRDFVFAPGRTPMEIYQAAVANGVSSQRLAAVTGISPEEINRFVRDNNLAAFKQGTDFIPHDGIALLHRGEAVTPSSLVDEVKALREELAELRREQNQQTQALVNVVIESQRMNANLIIEHHEDLAKSSAWRDQARAVMR